MFPWLRSIEQSLKKRGKELFLYILNALGIPIEGNGGRKEEIMKE